MVFYKTFLLVSTQPRGVGAACSLVVHAGLQTFSSRELSSLKDPR